MRFIGAERKNNQVRIQFDNLTNILRCSKRSTSRSVYSYYVIHNSCGPRFLRQSRSTVTHLHIEHGLPSEIVFQLTPYNIRIHMPPHMRIADVHDT